MLAPVLGHLGSFVAARRWRALGFDAGSLASCVNSTFAKEEFGARLVALPQQPSYLSLVAP